MIAPTSDFELLLSEIIHLTFSRHLSSSYLFSCSYYAKGYLSLGNEAIGQSKVGMCYIFAFLSLADKVYTELPWNEFSKPSTDNCEISVTL
jgi:hypothetical protein